MLPSETVCLILSLLLALEELLPQPSVDIILDSIVILIPMVDIRDIRLTFFRNFSDPWRQLHVPWLQLQLDDWRILSSVGYSRNSIWVRRYECWTSWMSPVPHWRYRTVCQVWIVYFLDFDPVADFRVFFQFCLWHFHYLHHWGKLEPWVV